MFYIFLDYMPIVSLIFSEDRWQKEDTIGTRIKPEGRFFGILIYNNYL